MKQQPTATKLLQKTYQIFEDIERISKRVQEQQRTPFSVEFFHKANLELSFMKWSDQWQSYDAKDDKFMYRYEISSKGIHFVAFEEMEIGKPLWHSSVRYWSSSHQINCSLLSIPNTGPKEGQSMYSFHQEKIRETLSILPAWTIAIISN